MARPLRIRRELGPRLEHGVESLAKISERADECGDRNVRRPAEGLPRRATLAGRARIEAGRVDTVVDRPDTPWLDTKMDVQVLGRTGGIRDDQRRATQGGALEGEEHPVHQLPPPPRRPATKRLGGVGRMHVVHPIRRRPDAVATVDKHPRASPGQTPRPPSAADVDEGRGGRIRAGGFRDAMDDDVARAREIRRNPVRDQMDLAPAPHGVVGEREVGHIHPTGLHEVTGDEDVRAVEHLVPESSPERLVGQRVRPCHELGAPRAQGRARREAIDGDGEALEVLLIPGAVVIEQHLRRKDLRGRADTARQDVLPGRHVLHELARGPRLPDGVVRLSGERDVEGGQLVPCLRPVAGVDEQDAIADAASGSEVAKSRHTVARDQKHPDDVPPGRASDGFDHVAAVAPLPTRVPVRRTQHPDDDGFARDPPAPTQMIAVADAGELRVEAIGNHDAVPSRHRPHPLREAARPHDDRRRQAIAQPLDDHAHQGPDCAAPSRRAYERRRRVARVEDDSRARRQSRGQPRQHRRDGAIHEIDARGPTSEDAEGEGRHRSQPAATPMKDHCVPGCLRHPRRPLRRGAPGRAVHHDQHRRSRPRHAGPPGAEARVPTRGQEMSAATIPRDGRSSREHAAKSSPFSSQNCRPNSPMKSG